MPPKKKSQASVGDTAPVIVYDFWCEPADRESATRVQDQIALACDYRYALARLENTRRAAIRDLDLPEVKAKRSQLLTIVAQLSQIHKRMESAQLAEVAQLTVEREALIANLETLRDQITKLYEKQRVLGAIARAKENGEDPPTAAFKFSAGDLKQAMSRTKKTASIFEEFNDKKKKLRALFSHEGPKDPLRPWKPKAALYWGTYLVAENAHDQSCEETPIYRDIRPELTPNEGTIAVQFQTQKGHDRPLCRDLYSVDQKRVRIHTEKYALGPTRFGVREASQTAVTRQNQPKPKRLQRLEVRVGSTGPGNKTPIFAAFHVLLHRELPPDSAIKWVKIHRIVTGQQVRYRAQFTITAPEVPQVIPSAAACGVDIGWRTVVNGTRVAFAVGSDGATFELIASFNTTRRYTKSTELRQLRDRKMNSIKGLLGAWRKLEPGENGQFEILMDQDRVETVPLIGVPRETWVYAALEHAHTWRKVARLAQLVQTWGSNRVEGDDAVHNTVAEWLIKDRHLHNWEAHNLRKMRRTLHKQYEVWASMIAKRYGEIAVQDFNITKIREASTRVGDIASRMGHIVSPGLARAKIVAMATKHKRQLLKRRGPELKHCTACNQPRNAQDPAQLIVLCTNCGHEEDQDFGTATQLLRALTSPANSGGPLAGGRSAKSKQSSKSRKNVDGVQAI